MILQTKRLILRPWCEDDASDLYRYASDPDVGYPAGWPAHTSVDDSREIIRAVLSAPETYAVCLKESGQAIGSIGLKTGAATDMTDREDECELGYWVGKPFWGQGFIPEAATELLRHAFECLGMRAVFCGYYDGNQKSRRVQEKLGFVYQHKTEGLEVALLGEVRTGHLMLLTRERWADYHYCGYCNQCINDGLCHDIQMVSEGLLKPSAVSELSIDKSQACEQCGFCPHKFGDQT